MESDELLLFEEIELEEPSRRTDEEILAFARRRLPTRGPSPVGRRTAWAHLGVAAGLLIALSLLLPENRPAAPGRIGSEAVRAPIEEIRELRTELDQIGEMSELIPPEKQAEREAIAEKVKFCLASLEALEEKLQRFDQSSLQEVPRKEADI